MGYKKRDYTDKECAELEKLNGTVVLNLSINGNHICSMFQERYQRDPSVDELDDIIYCLDCSDIGDVVTGHAEEYIRNMMDSMFDADEGDEDDD